MLAKLKPQASRTLARLETATAINYFTSEKHLYTLLTINKYFDFVVYQEQTLGLPILSLKLAEHWQHWKHQHYK